MLHASYSTADSLPLLTVAQQQVEPITLSATVAGPWAESSTVATTASLTSEQSLDTAPSLYGADTLAVALALVGVWLMVMGGALIARRRVPV